MAYRVKKAFAGMPELTTVVDGVRVALNKAYSRTKDGTPTKPPETVNVPLATQEQLKAIFERGDPCVEQYEEKKMPEPRNFVAEHKIEGLNESETAKTLNEQQEKKKTTAKNEP